MCPDNWRRNNNNCYLPVYTDNSFSDAQDDCLSQNAMLVTFADQSELDFIKHLVDEMFQESSSSTIWV